jgi:hypothetical protein
MLCTLISAAPALFQVSATDISLVLSLAICYHEEKTEEKPGFPEKSSRSFLLNGGFTWSASISEKYSICSEPEHCAALSRNGAQHCPFLFSLAMRARSIPRGLPA